MPDQPLRLAGAVSAAAETIGAVIQPSARRSFQRRVLAARQALTAAAADVAWAEGRGMTPEAAAASVLDEMAEADEGAAAGAATAATPPVTARLVAVQ